MFRSIIISIGIVSLVMISGSCKKVTQPEKDELTISTYVQEHDLDAFRTESGLYVVIHEQGTGASCHSNSTVTVAYKGYFDNHEVFDSSTGATFSLSNVIEGWREGIPYFREGGTGMLLIPSGLAYGPQGAGDVIPPQTVLIFDIELLDVL